MVYLCYIVAYICYIVAYINYIISYICYIVTYTCYIVAYICYIVADCKFNCHKKCSPQVHKDCQGDVKWVPGGKDSNYHKQKQNMNSDITQSIEYE